MTAIPDKNILNGSSNPTTSQFKGQMGQLWDYLNERNDVNATASGLKVSTNKKLLGRNTSGAGAIEEITYSDQGYSMLTGVTQLGFRNKIINGDMRIDQRNGGASVTPSATATANYFIDRFSLWCSQGSKIIVGQNLDSVPVPAGFGNYLGAKTASAYSVGATDYFFVAQAIEGFNFVDAGFGTSGASNLTLSFWARSSITGTHSGSLRNYQATRSFPFVFTINAANTWEYKTVSIAGDTIGTWAYATPAGAAWLNFSLGVGPSYSGTNGSWSSANYVGAIGGTSVVGTVGANLYITGIQLEKGSVATPFERRPYGTELALCQRYYQSYNGIDTFGSCTTTDATHANTKILPVEMRATPTVTFSWASGTGASIIAVGNKAIRQSGVHNTNTFTNALTLAAEL